MPSLTWHSWFLLAGLGIAGIGLWAEWSAMRSLKASSALLIPAMGLGEVTIDLPAELSGERPRRVTLTRWGWFAVTMGTLGAVLLGTMLKFNLDISVDRNHRRTMLSTDGIPARATISGKYHGSGPGRSYSLYYRYPVDATKHFGSASVSQVVYESVEQGSVIDIIHSTSEPWINRFGAELPDESPWTDLWPVALTLGLVVLLWRTVRDWWLLRHGTVACAFVTGISRSGKTDLICYHFRDSNGHTVFGTGKATRESDLSIGDGVFVLYSPKRSSRSHPYAMVMARVVGATPP